MEKYFPVVGITGKMNMTLKVLEAILPEYFEGATKVYYGKSFIRKNLHETKYKKPVSEEVKQILRANFTHEIEFYEFCRQRLQRQFDLLS